MAVALACGKLSKVFYSYEHHFDLTLLFSYQVLPLLIYSAIGVLLCRPAVLGFLDITDEFKKGVWLVGTAAGILMIIIV
jgi:hypothetical protein